MLKKIILYSLICTTLFGVEECVLLTSEPFGYTGDISGKRVYTKEKYIYECTDTVVKRGECKQWEEIYQDYNVSDYNGNVYYESENFQGSMGSLFATAQSYDKINGLWSGWKGICMTGADEGNWDWLSDPYVLAGYALSMVSAGAGSYIANVDVKKIVDYSVCAARAGLDVGKMIEEYNSEDIPCDPVDELCGDEDKAPDDTNIFTVPENKFNEMIGNNPDMVEFMLVLDGVGTGVLTVKVTDPNLDTTGMDASKAMAAAAEIKKKMLLIRGALTTVQLGSCLIGRDTGGNSGSNSESLTSASNLTTMALSAVNPLLGMAASIAMNVVNSFTSKIDTCHDEDDAKEKGSRHEATYNATKYDLCHLIEVKESGKKLLNTYRKTFKYCCYDNKITKMLVEQTKAQFAKDWQHCTDITLKELQVVSFRSCDPTELDSSLDGAKLDAFAPLSTRTQAYQFTHKCIDTRGIVEETLSKFGGEDILLDERDVKELLEELK